MSDKKHDILERSQHWVRYGIAADQQYLMGDFNFTYDCLIVNGNMFAHMPSALSQFITQKAKKPYILDPQTHALAFDIDYLLSTGKKSAGEMKRSWRNLLSKYGEIVARTLLNEESQQRPVCVDDFSDIEERKEFVEAVLCFQNESIKRELEEGEDREYLEFLQKKNKKNPLNDPPAMLIAPYFYIAGAEEEQWLKLNCDLIEDARVICKEHGLRQPLAAQVVIPRESLISQKMREKIIEEYSKIKPDLVLLWIDDFCEHSASRETLDAYLQLLDRFGRRDIKVANLYGGFFSVATMRFSEEVTNLVAVCHGLEYGEKRSVVPLGGGTPVARFYSRTMHHRLPPRVALREMHQLQAFHSKEDFYKKICDCKNCRELIQNSPAQDVGSYFEVKSSAYWRAGKFVSNDFPTATASDNCTKHYMWCKYWEYREYTSSIEKLKAELLQYYRDHGKALGNETTGHTLTWSLVLK